MPKTVRGGKSKVIAMSNISLYTKPVGKIEGNFLIPAYQRGYRWNSEVIILLNDLAGIPDGANYCLQPIVVKKLDSDKFELIDGQQRLTTLYLILRYIKTYLPRMNVRFNIDYKIRKDSKKFLTDIDFENATDNASNIDEYFINTAARTISKWFESTPDANNTAIRMADKLNNKVSVIWYEIDSEENASELFTRLNIGKIPLTNAELVKAIFLSRNNGIDVRYQLEICTQWDTIENELHDDRLWGFITNKNPDGFPTRIELLFDLMADKRDNDRERFRTFFWFDEKARSDEFKEKKIDLWKQVVENFQRLKEWYNDHELYHKIGYIIAVGQKTLNELMDKSAKMGKTTFRHSLDKLIAESIKFGDKDYQDLKYGSDGDRINKLLLLFNVESARQNGDKTMRFPFWLHKNQKGGWSLEHIHAQHSEGLNTREQWNEWLDLHVQSLRNINEEKNAELIHDIESRNRESFNGDHFKAWFDKVITAFGLETDFDYIDLLGNMALLAKFDNSALNNATFDVKRDKIIEMDKQGCYIPICTRRVFLKYYTPSEKNQLHFWGEDDRKAYLKAMDETLKPYLSIIGKEI